MWTDADGSTRDVTARRSALKVRSSSVIYLIFLETPADDIGLPNRNLPTLFLTESITRFCFNIEETG